MECVWSWNKNDYGQIGESKDIIERDTIEQIIPLSDIKHIKCGAVLQVMH